ncbi:MAG: AAA family ATPase [bacterium]|nr:AAA family ATPase [bacterium]
MYLKRLELLGFKSFAQKTTLDFPGGIAGIVGPNGSGKSNVIDAIRWILGEREAKNLRGARAEDLIFSGTPKRTRMGMAQVSLTFDNSSGFFPVDFSEVTIVRRIDRDSSSQYFLNKAEVRLRDVVDFFAKSRLGTRGLAIVNQGDSDLFVKASPEERREMVEEILGLRQYQLKKQEAERKLRNTGINLEKVRAMIEEIAPHLRFLKRQTAKWEKLSEIEKELRSLEDIYFGLKLKEISAGLARFEPEIKKLDGEIAGKEKELRALKADLEKVEAGQPGQKNQISEIRQKRERLLQERAGLERDISKLEAKIEFLLSVSASQQVDLRSGELLAVLEEVKEVIQKVLQFSGVEEIHVSLKNLLVKIAGVTDSSSRQKQEIGELKSAREAMLKKIQPLSAELDSLAKMEEESARGFETFNKDFRQAFENLEKKKDEISKLESEKNRVLFEIERINLRKQDLEMQASQANRKLEEFSLENIILPEGMAFPDLERRLMRLRSEIAGVGAVDQALIKEAQETESRHSFLETQLADLEKATNDLGELIKELDLKIHTDFSKALHSINDEFNKFFQLMFGGGRASMRLEKIEKKAPIEEMMEGGEKQIVAESEEEHNELSAGIDVEVHIPRKKIQGLEMLSGGEKTLVSIAALFALISVSPPPFLVLDEIDAALDERNTKRFADLIRDFSKQTQFLIVTHNRATMESASVLYGVTMEEDGVSKVLSLKLE